MCKIVHGLPNEGTDTIILVFSSKDDQQRIQLQLTLHIQCWSEIIETNAKNGVAPVATSNVKLFLKTIW